MFDLVVAGERGEALLQSAENRAGGVVAFFNSAQEPFLAEFEVFDGAAEGLDLLLVGAGLVEVGGGEGGSEEFLAVGAKDVG
ncbi:MAG TPA: hypothetical protein VN748_00350, partial [Pseudonocardiaceae bacterium]|nr:hypothetical protein [Pseudonocardiaceae bacterium]